MNPFRTFFYSLKRTLFDFSYYEDIRQASFGFSFKYLWFLMFLFILVRSVDLGSQYIENRPNITPGVNRVVEYAENFYPTELEINIIDGQLSTNVEEPYIFNIDQNGRRGGSRHLAIIDTEGTVDKYPDYNTYILATRNALVYPSRTGDDGITQTSVFYFKDLKNDFTLNENIYNSFIDTIKPYASKAVVFVDWFVVTGLVFMVTFGSLLWTLMTMFGLLFLTFAVWLINLLFRKGFKYSTLFRFGMHAITWPLLFSEIVRIFNLPISNLSLIIFLIIMITVVFSTNNKVNVETKKLKVKK